MNNRDWISSDRYTCRCDRDRDSGNRDCSIGSNKMAGRGSESEVDIYKNRKMAVIVAVSQHRLIDNNIIGKCRETKIRENTVREYHLKIVIKMRGQ